MSRHRDTCLETLWRIGVGCGLHSDDLDHRATGEERRHGLQEVIATPQHPDSQRAEHLVTAERDEVDAELDHVNGHVRRRLAGVQDRQRPDRTSPLHDGGNGIDRAQDVGDVGERDDLGAVGDDRAQITQVEATIIGNTDPAKRGARAPCQLLPRNEVGVMFHLGNHDLVAHPEPEPRRERWVDAVHGASRRSVAEGVGHQVERLSGVLGEHHLPGLRADEGGHRLAGALKGVGGFFGQLMGTPVNRGVVLLIEPAFGIEHPARLVRGSPGVEVHQGLSATDGARQDREVTANGGRLRGRERGSHCDVRHRAHPVPQASTLRNRS